MKDEKAEAGEALEHLTYFNNLLQQAIGKPDIYAVADAKIAAFGFNNIARMIYNPYEGQILTGKMMRALLNKVYTLGVMVLNSCEIKEVKNEPGHITLKTNQGNFKTSKVILATNAFANQLFPELNVTPGQ